MLQPSLAHAGMGPDVPLGCPHCCDGAPHVLPGGVAAIPLQACRAEHHCLLDLATYLCCKACITLTWSKEAFPVAGGGSRVD